MDVKDAKRRIMLRLATSGVGRFISEAQLARDCGMYLADVQDAVGILFVEWRIDQKTIYANDGETNEVYVAMRPQQMDCQRSIGGHYDAEV
jgi:hypothetical protein